MRYLLVLAALATPACAQPNVAVDIGPIHALVAQVMEGVGTPSLLIGDGADPHHFQLRPSQRRALDQAEVLFWTGEALTPWLAEVDTGAISVELGEAPGITPRPPMFGGHAEADVADHADDQHGVHDDHGGTDPHVWLDPENGKAMVAQIARTLAAVDPANAARYADNAARATAGLDALEAEIAAKLEPWHDARLVVFHDAFAHFAGRFGVTIVGSVALGDAADPGAATIRRLTAMAQGGGVDCAFAEPQHNDGAIRALAADTGIRFGTLDPEGTSLPPGPGLYAATLRSIADAIDTCLAGG
jgi:zinc transport system substrate-binding protein